VKMWLTRGMFGEKTELITETDNAKTVLERLFMWKNDENVKQRYKVEKYDRIIFGEDSVAFDFGDYSWFILVEGVKPEDKNTFIGK